MLTRIKKAYIQWHRDRLSVKPECLSVTISMPWYRLAKLDYDWGFTILKPMQRWNLHQHAMLAYDATDKSTMWRRYLRMDERQLVRSVIFNERGDRLNSWHWEAHGVTDRQINALRREYASDFISKGISPAHDETRLNFDAGAYKVGWWADAGASVSWIELIIDFPQPKDAVSFDQFRRRLSVQNGGCCISFADLDPTWPWGAFEEIHKIDPSLTI